MKADEIVRFFREVEAAIPSDVAVLMIAMATEGERKISVLTNVPRTGAITLAKTFLDHEGKPLAEPEWKLLSRSPKDL